jgi:hypothetical protein
MGWSCCGKNMQNYSGKIKRVALPDFFMLINKE